MGRAFRTLAGRILGIVVLLWARSWRVVIEENTEPLLERCGARSGERAVFAFLHGQQMALVRGSGRVPIHVMVSHSTDGDIQAGVMRTFGLRVVRGSTSKGGSVALRGLVRRLREGQSACFAVDGPRGPLGVVKRGAALAAEAGRARLVPVAAAASRCAVLGRTWDRFEIPWPFARVAIVLAAPISPAVVLRDPNALALALAQARRRAICAALPGSRHTGGVAGTR